MSLRGRGVWIIGTLAVSTLAAGRAARESRMVAELPRADSASRAAALAVLGRQLFADPILSRDATLACSSCHIPAYAFAEPRRVSHGRGLLARRRNAPSLLGRGEEDGRLDWDGRAASLAAQLDGVFSVHGDFGWTLEDAAARVGRDSGYRALVARLLRRSPDASVVRDALVSFQRTLRADTTPFERAYFGGDSTAVSPSVWRGWSLFRSGRSGCAGCHVPLPAPGTNGLLQFRDGRFHNLGVGYANGRYADVGRFALTQRPSDLGTFLTPSLRNVARTAPYMHDGSISRLEEVVAFYDSGGVANPHRDPVMVPRRFTPRERADLLSFLRALTTDGPAERAAIDPVPWVPFP